MQNITIHIEEEAETPEQMALILERIAERLRKGDTKGFIPSFTIISVADAARA